MRSRTDPAFLVSLGNFLQEPGRQCNNRPEKHENAADSNSQYAEGEEKKPHQRIENKRDQRCRPAKNKKDAPEQKFDQAGPPGS